MASLRCELALEYAMVVMYQLHHLARGLLALPVETHHVGQYLFEAIQLVLDLRQLQRGYSSQRFLAPGLEPLNRAAGEQSRVACEVGHEVRVRVIEAKHHSHILLHPSSEQLEGVPVFELASHGVLQLRLKLLKREQLRDLP